MQMTQMFGLRRRHPVRFDACVSGSLLGYEFHQDRRKGKIFMRRNCNTSNPKALTATHSAPGLLLAYFVVREQ